MVVVVVQYVLVAGEEDAVYSAVCSMLSVWVLSMVCGTVYL